MTVNEIKNFPFVEFGKDIKRQVRLIISPATSCEERISIVSVRIPPQGISEGHIHDDIDEYIYFDSDGSALIDGTEYKVNKNSLIFAPIGKKHECKNDSKTEYLNLLCIFVPSLKPYGKYPELIEKTKTYLKGVENE